jgi:hypothetical protein
VRFPDKVKRAAPIAGTAQNTPHDFLFTKALNEAITWPRTPAATSPRRCPGSPRRRSSCRSARTCSSRSPTARPNSLIPGSELRVVDDVLGHLGLFGVAPTDMPQIDRHLADLLAVPV